jgi:hypothetical protein
MSQGDQLMSDAMSDNLAARMLRRIQAQGARANRWDLDFLKSVADPSRPMSEGEKAILRRLALTYGVPLVEEADGPGASLI